MAGTPWQLSASGTISPGATVRYWYWWPSNGRGVSNGPQEALASPVGAINTQSNWVAATKQAFQFLDNGCTYWVEFTCEDHLGGDEYGVFDVWVQGFWR